MENKESTSSWEECKCGCEGGNKDFTPEKIWDKNCIYYPKVECACGAKHVDYKVAHLPNCPMSKENIKIEQNSWVKRFDEKISKYKWVFRDKENIDRTLDYVKFFLQSEISLAVEQEKERVLAMVLKEIEGMYKSNPKRDDIFFGYNKALDTLKEKLQAKQ